MTVRELYDWAVEHDALDKDMVVIVENYGWSAYEDIDAHYVDNDNDCVVMGA